MPEQPITGLRSSMYLSAISFSELLNSGSSISISNNGVLQKRHRPSRLESNLATSQCWQNVVFILIIFYHLHYRIFGKEKAVRFDDLWYNMPTIEWLARVVGSSPKGGVCLRGG